MVLSVVSFILIGGVIVFGSLLSTGTLITLDQFFEMIGLQKVIDKYIMQC